MDDKKLYHFSAVFAFCMAVAVLGNGIAFFTGPHLFFAITRSLVGIFALGFFPALYVKAQDAHPGWAIWAMSLAYVGITAELIRYLGNLEYETPWLFLGGLGVMLLTYNILALQHNLWPKVLAWFGIIIAILLLGVIPSTLVDALAFLNTLVAVGAVLLYPIWLIWMGMRFRAA